MVALTFASWNLIGEFLRRLDALKTSGLIAVGWYVGLYVAAVHH